jgi:hypothetical protein
MDKEFLDQYPPEWTQGLRTVLDKLEEETDEGIRAKLFGQLALGLERLKAMTENRQPHGVEQI